MAKKEEMKSIGKSKMTGVMFHTEGDDATLQEGFRTVSLAMTSLLKATQTPVPRKALAAATAPGETVDVSEMNEEPNEEEAPGDVEMETVRPSKQRYYPSPETIKDLDLNNGKITLKAFLEAKAVRDNDSKRSLVL